MKFIKKLTALFYPQPAPAAYSHQRLDAFLNLPPAQAVSLFPDLAWAYHFQAIAFRVFCNATETGEAVPGTLLRNARRAHQLIHAVLKQWDKPDKRKPLEQQVSLSHARSVRVDECLAIREDIHALQSQALEDGEAFAMITQQRYLSWCALYFDDFNRSLLRFKPLLQMQNLIEQASILAPIYFNRTEEGILPQYLAELGMRQLAWEVPVWQSWELEPLLKQISQSKILRSQTVNSMAHQLQQEREQAKTHIRQHAISTKASDTEQKHAQLCKHLSSLHEVY